MPPVQTDVPSAVRETLTAVAEAQPMRRGSLSERWVKCSRSGCPCSDKPDARHGPYFSLTRMIAGKTRSRFLTAEQAEIARRQIDAAHRFRKRLEAYWQACERWADAQLDDAAPAPKGEKRGSRRRSKRSLPERSRRS
jgi:hypothetical protein